MNDKIEHVRQSKQTRNHTCHWPDCKMLVPPAKYMCMSHWMQLPKVLRTELWEAYEIGQEETMSPSEKYIEVHHKIQDWIANRNRVNTIKRTK